MSLKQVPEWVKVILAIAGVMVTVTLAYANVKSDIAVLQQRNNYIEDSIREIKELLREELNYHHRGR